MVFNLLFVNSSDSCIFRSFLSIYQGNENEEQLYSLHAGKQKFWTFLSCNHSKKATEQYFSVVLFIMLNKVVLTFES